MHQATMFQYAGAMLEDAAGESKRESAEKRQHIAEQQAKAAVLEAELAQLDKQRLALAGMGMLCHPRHHVMGPGRNVWDSCLAGFPSHADLFVI
jgi:hypothetical protein